MKKRDDSYPWRCYPHTCRPDDKGECYCRAVNEILPFSEDRCMNCPLCNGEEAEISCVYYDLRLPTDMLNEPSAKKRYIDGLIAAGLTGNFPDFIDDTDRDTLGAVTPEVWTRADRLNVERAFQFAADAHKGTVRKGTQIPYIVHPMEAAMIAMQMTDDPEVAIAAVLHDVVEDTAFTSADIEERFGRRVAGLVSDESENKRPEQRAEDTWKLRKREAIEHLSKASEEAKMIALADKLSNLRSIKRDYEDIGEKLWERFNQSDKREHAWYYREIASMLDELSYTRAWQEYNRLVKATFPEGSSGECKE